MCRTPVICMFHTCNTGVYIYIYIFVLDEILTESKKSSVQWPFLLSIAVYSQYLFIIQVYSLYMYYMFRTTCVIQVYNICV